MRSAGFVVTAFLLFLLPAAAGAKPFPVTTTADTGAGSLRDAVIGANVNPEADTIPIDVTGTIELESALPGLAGNVEIQGPGSDRLTVRRKTGSFNIFIVNNAAVATISGLTVSNGRSSFGGGIASLGTLTLEGVVVSGNEAVETGGTIAVAQGGGIAATGPLTLVRSTVSGNIALAKDGTSITISKGGGISGGSAPMVIDRSTVSGNVSKASSAASSIVVGQAGGLISIKGLQLTQSTVSGNVAEGEASSGATGRAGGIDASEGLTISGSTVTANSALGEIKSSANINGFGPTSVRDSIVSDPVGGATSCLLPLTSAGYNIDSGKSCGFSQPTDLPSTDPGIDPTLASNDGPTQTHALLPGSPAIDHGNSFGEGSDQRGLPRPIDFPLIANAPGGDGSDIGAFELQLPVALRDLTPPQTKIDKAPPKRTRKRLAKFRFSSNEPGSRFECRLDRKRFAPCASPLKRKVKRGKHIFRVRAIDAAGNVDPTPAQSKWRVMELKHHG